MAISMNINIDEAEKLLKEDKDKKQKEKIETLEKINRFVDESFKGYNFTYTQE